MATKMPPDRCDLGEHFDWSPCHQLVKGKPTNGLLPVDEKLALEVLWKIGKVRPSSADLSKLKKICISHNDKWTVVFDQNSTRCVIAIS